MQFCRSLKKLTLAYLLQIALEIMWLPILIGFFFDSFNFFSLRIFVTLGHKSNFVISLCVFLQRNSHQGSLLAFFSYEVFLTLSRTDHWDAHYVVTQIIELKYVPCSFWFKRRNLNEMFTWEKDKTFVTHSCSQFHFPSNHHKRELQVVNTGERGFQGGQ